MITAGLSLFFFTALAGPLMVRLCLPANRMDGSVHLDRTLGGGRPGETDEAGQSALDSQTRFYANLPSRPCGFYWPRGPGLPLSGSFSPIRELGAGIASFSLGPWETFWTIFYGFATYGNAGFLREQVCKYMCPYARFQSAMFDKDTLIISYDTDRGEPRGGRRKKDDAKDKGLGDCINCTLCVQVCPTGIDIRDGLQYECIACAACIDVCDEVMDKMNYPRGLVRYTTEHALKHNVGHVIRPRIIVYGVLLLVIVSSTLWGMTHRIPLKADMIRDRNALYREVSGDMIENVYTLKITNMDNEPHQYSVKVLNNDAVEVDISKPLSLQAEENAGVSMRLRIPRSAGQGVQNLEIEFQAEDDPSIRKVITAKALMPVKFGN